MVARSSVEPSQRKPEARLDTLAARRGGSEKVVSNNLSFTFWLGGNHEPNHDFISKVLPGFGQHFEIPTHRPPLPKPSEGAQGDPWAVQGHEPGGDMDRWGR